MKKLLFGLSITVLMMLVSCASDTSKEAKESTNLGDKISNNSVQGIAKTDSTTTMLDRTSSTIEQNIKALNKAETDLMKEFELK